MKRLLIPLLAFSTPACAQPYMDLGLSIQSGCLVDYDIKRGVPGCSDNPFGVIVAGYKWQALSFEIEHRSSLREKDRGLNAAVIKYRFSFPESTP